MTDNTEPNSGSKHLDRAGCLFLAALLIMIPFLIQTLIEGDTTAVAPDVTSNGLPSVDVKFELQFLPGFWSEGPHQYTLSYTCPRWSFPVTAAHSFQVSASSTSPAGHVYLRPDGLMISKSGPDAAVTQFNPSQPSSALVLLDLAPESAAEECTAFINWDGFSMPLPRTDIYTVDVDSDW